MEVHHAVLHRRLVRAAIVFTANHYIVDAFVGLIVCLAGVLLALAAQRWVYPWVRIRLGASAP